MLSERSSLRGQYIELDTLRAKTERAQYIFQEWSSRSSSIIIIFFGIINIFKPNLARVSFSMCVCDLASNHLQDHSSSFYPSSVFFTFSREREKFSYFYFLNMISITAYIMLRPTVLGLSYRSVRPFKSVY